LYLCRRIDVLARNRTKLILEKIQFRKERLAVTATSREAARIKKANSELLAATSHDLRQPMHAARLFISMLEIADPQDMKIRKDLHDKINLAFNSMESMLDSLLNFSYLKSGKSQIEKRPFALADICTNLCQEFSGLAAEQGVTLKLIPSSLHVETDRLWLERLLRNLIANAIKYAPGKKVLVGARSKGDFVHIQIFDTGPGMSTSELEKMFDEFQSFNKENTPSEGSLGLGLAIVSRIAQLLGLEIRVQSDVGVGTRFTVIVPRMNTVKNGHEKRIPAQA
ncbi:MAG: HAMP domain-containing sensor histidine kinase, partial [Sneathiella sp.]